MNIYQYGMSQGADVELIQACPSNSSALVGVSAVWATWSMSPQGLPVSLPTGWGRISAIQSSLPHAGWPAPFITWALRLGCRVWCRHTSLAEVLGSGSVGRDGIHETGILPHSIGHTVPHSITTWFLTLLRLAIRAASLAGSTSGRGRGQLCTVCGGCIGFGLELTSFSFSPLLCSGLRVVTAGCSLSIAGVHPLAMRQSLQNLRLPVLGQHHARISRG